jgi:16S rRNA (guanine527-N7)-methyltransferase
MRESNKTESPMSEILPRVLGSAGYILTAKEMMDFTCYAELLRDWNTRINLTAIVDNEGIALRHFVDSLSILAMVDRERARIAPEAIRMIDVGTGAGFPGIPIRIVRPDLQLTLLDSLQKRIAFLDAVVGALALGDVSTLKDRAEDAGMKSPYREKFHIATARAVAPMAVLCEYTLPFVQVGGLMIAMKGQKKDEIEQATQAIKILGGQIEAVESFVLNGSDLTRTLVLIRKTTATPPSYPRKAGFPERHPLT